MKVVYVQHLELADRAVFRHIYLTSALSQHVTQGYFMCVAYAYEYGRRRDGKMSNFTMIYNGQELVKERMNKND